MKMVNYRQTVIRNKWLISLLSLFLGSLILIAIKLFTPQRVVMSYFVPEEPINQQWRKKLDYVTVLAYAFLHVNQDGEVNIGGSTLSASLSTFSSFTNKNKQLKKIISFGGADDHSSFFYAINHPDHFVDSVDKIITLYRLSGVDLDFEINRPYTVEEANAYAYLIDKLRKRLGSRKIISMATIIDRDTLNSMGNSNWSLLAKNLSFISMMCYDLTSAFSKPAYTSFSSNLYPVHDAPTWLFNANNSCDQSMLYLTGLGVPFSKMVLGLPAYAIAFGGVHSDNQGLFQPSNSTQVPVFDDMGRGLLRYSTVVQLNGHGFKEHRLVSNGVVNGVWSYNAETQQFITFDNPETVRSKLNYAIKNRLAGVMMWRIGQDVGIDDPLSLLKALSEP